MPENATGTLNGRLECLCQSDVKTSFPENLNLSYIRHKSGLRSLRNPAIIYDQH
jgi:hypothetical protein